MGIFSNTKITEKHIKLINTYLPKEINVDTFKIDEVEYLKSRIENYKHELKIKLVEQSKTLIKLKEERFIDKYRFYNVPIKGKSLGMVDIGSVHRFNAKSTGNSFENGMIQYAIETSSENTWAENNAQYSAVQMAQNNLKLKAISIFPESNAIENFSINFRELGSSGNVFIYANGTATISDNINSTEGDKEINSLINEIKDINKKIEDAQLKHLKLPNYKEIKNKLKNLN